MLAAVTLGLAALCMAGMGVTPRAGALLFLAVAAMGGIAGFIAWVFLRRRGS